MSSSQQTIGHALVGLSYGDEGKGKVSYSLMKHSLSTSTPYDLCVRFNGGPNAGHTIYHENKKFAVHGVPVGALLGIPSLISTGCVLDPRKLRKELIDLGLEEWSKDNLYISKNVHIITEDDIEEDKRTNKIGTTGSGIGPTCSKETLRLENRRVESNLDENGRYLGFQVVDPVRFYQKFKMIFFEGAQGYGLDLKLGHYPYVTSTCPTVAGVCLSGFPYKNIRRVYGTTKTYDTYVGDYDLSLNLPSSEREDNEKYQAHQKNFDILGELGHEFGATTGRKRQVGYFDSEMYKDACQVNGVTHVIFNKTDISEQANVFTIVQEGKLEHYPDIDDMSQRLCRMTPKNVPVFFSRSPLGLEEEFFSYYNH